MSTGPNPGSETATTGTTPPVDAGRVTLGTPESGNPAGNPPSTTTGGGEGNSADAWAGLQDEGNRTLVTSKGWKSPDDAIKGYAALEAKLGSSLTVPGSDASAEEWTAFYAKVGRPETADKYEFKLPDGVPKDMPYDAKIAQSLKEWSHKAGLSTQQAAAIHDEYVRYAAGTMSGLAAQQEAATEAAHAALVKEWGAPDTPKFTRNVELANRAIRNMGGNELVAELRSFGVLNAEGTPLSPKLAIALAKAGEGMYAEDTLFGKPETHSANPFSRGATENMTEQNRLIKEARSDPAKKEYLLSLARTAVPPVNPAELGFSGH